MRASTVVWGLLAALVASQAAAQQKPISWNYSPNAQGSAGSAYTTYTHKPFAEILAKDTGGRLRLNVLEQLIPGPKVTDAVLDGTIDMGTQIVGFRAEMALLNFVALPMIPLGKVQAMLPELRPILRQQVEQVHGAVLLGYGFWGQQRLITKQPVRTIAQFKGYKIRVNSTEALMMFKAAGATPVFIPMAEAYTSLQRGVVEGANSSLEGIYGNKFHEVVKNVSNWPLGLTSWIWLANKKSFGALPRDLQATLIKLFEEKYEPMSITGSMADDERQKKLLEGMGIKFYDPAPAEAAQFMKAAPEIMADWKKRAGPNADKLIAVINKHLGTKY